MINTLMLFMDDSITFDDTKKNIKFGSLTGILIPPNLVIKLLMEIYNLLANNLSHKISPNVLDTSLFDNLLHGCNFMPGYDDSIKIKTLNGLIDIIVNNNLSIIRFCHIISDKNKKFFYTTNNPKNFIINACWARLVSYLHDFLKENIVIPVMEDDKTNEQLTIMFSGLIKSAHSILNINQSSCSLPNCKNLFEVLYSKKSYSLLTGLVDCISHCLQLRQNNINNTSISKYKKNCIDAIEKIPEALIEEHIIDIDYVEGKKYTSCSIKSLQK